ncbi:hypothetical protein [Micromonospora rosaria]|uniref:hypothetical protein n=1 Tax=Micromonospora rosaria TaxID=47874 RepID=UPI00082ADF81|nr:hypothetical protein [Micromonospora rosaria]
MPYLDPIDRWIAAATGRTLAQHAADPVPAAVHLPEAAAALRFLRNELLLTVDRLRTLLLNTDDLSEPCTVTSTVETITDLTDDYHQARDRVDTLIADTTPTA